MPSKSTTPATPKTSRTTATSTTASRISEGQLSLFPGQSFTLDPEYYRPSGPLSDEAGVNELYFGGCSTPSSLLKPPGIPRLPVVKLASQTDIRRRACPMSPRRGCRGRKRGMAEGGRDEERPSRNELRLSTGFDLLRRGSDEGRAHSGLIIVIISSPFREHCARLSTIRTVIDQTRDILRRTENNIDGRGGNKFDSMPL